MTNTKRIWGTTHLFYEGGPILGRKVANRSFMDALLEKDYFAEYHFFLPSQELLEGTQNNMRGVARDFFESGKVKLFLQRDLPSALHKTNYYCFHLSDPFTGYTSTQILRNLYSANLFPITAPTHSLSYSEYPASFLQHLWQGSIPERDAVLATSSAGKKVVEGMYTSVRRSYALSKEVFPAPSVLRLPLGVHPGSMPSPEERNTLGVKERQRLGINPDATVFLCFARISYFSKLDVLPLLRAFKRAEEQGAAPASYHLIVAGWEDEEDNFGDEIKRFAANLRIPCSVVPRPTDAQRKAVYAAADVFISPSDNLQETFGLTMLEAAAASLPVIASDFDGYKDLVIDGVTGLLVPTLGPGAADASSLLAQVSLASEYHLFFAQQCVVDVPRMGQAIVQMIHNPEMRQRMGVAGRQRALAEFSWSHIVELHIALWEKLASTPLSPEEEKRIRSAVHPCAIDYMEIFGDYFSMRTASKSSMHKNSVVDSLLASERMVQWSRAGEAVYRGKDFPVIYALIEQRVPPEVLKKMLFSARKPVQLGLLLEQFAFSGAYSDADFLVLWALKHDFLEFVE